MDNAFQEEYPDYFPCLLDGSHVPEDFQYLCFCCGVCCRLRVFLSLEDAEHITQYAGLPFEKFLVKNDDVNFCKLGGFILRQCDGTCFFLKPKYGTGETRCRIYEVRPMACREFVLSLSRRECQEGLAKLWGIRVTPSGRLEGSEEKLKTFNTFIQSLEFGGG